MSKNKVEVSLSQVLEKERDIEFSILLDQAIWELIEKEEFKDKKGSEAFRFAMHWIRAMQYFMRQGESIADCAVKSWALAGIKDITESQFHDALDLILTTWKYKFELLDWVLKYENLGPGFVKNLSDINFLIGENREVVAGHMLKGAKLAKMRLSTYVMGVWYSVWPRMNEDSSLNYLNYLIELSNNEGTLELI